jgi:hypothetical protein
MSGVDRSLYGSLLHCPDSSGIASRRNLVWYSVGCKFFSLPNNVPDLTEHQIFQTLTITYASEVCPVALRGYLTTYVNFCWGLGQVIGIGVIKSMLPRQDQWSYRIPYALQWMYVFPAIYSQ